MNAVSVRDLRRTYTSTKGLFAQKRTSREALRGVDLEVRDGELFGLLGPNGAGKTTLVKILATILLPTSGSVEILGLDVVRQAQEVRERIGLVFGGERGLYTSVSARDLLLFWAAMYKLPDAVARQRISETLARVGLADRADERVETYSRGMKQRLHLARGLITQPRLLLLDEPTIGLDPVAAREIRALVQELHKAGTSVLITTHYLAEAEMLCERVAFINEGQIIAIDKPRVLTQLASELTVVEADVPREQAESLKAAFAGPKATVTTRATETPELERVVISGARLDYPRVLRQLAEAGAQRVITKEPTLEDVYVRMLGERGTRT